MPKIFNPEALLALHPKEYSSYMKKVIRCSIGIAILLVLLFVFALCFNMESNLLIFEVAKIILSFAVLFSLIMVFIQSCMARSHKQTFIELQKSHKAIELIYEWSRDSSAEMFLVRRIVDKMPIDELRKLADGNDPIIIPTKDYDVLRGFLPKRIVKTAKRENFCENRFKGKKIKYVKYQCRHESKCIAANSHPLSMSETIWLRSMVIKYLNILEVIMYAWKANLVNKDVIEQEFSYLVKSERDGSVVLKNFRDMLGQETMPGIYSFCEELSERNKKKIVEETYNG